MEWISHHQAAAWLIAALVLGAGEMLVGELVLLMLGVGALAGGLVALLVAGFPVPALVAAAVAVGMLALVRPPVLERLHRGHDLVTGPDRLVGANGTITTRPSAAGALAQARIGGETWSVHPQPGAVDLEPGTTVEVVAIRGAAAVVRPLPMEQLYTSDEFERGE